MTTRTTETHRLPAAGMANARNLKILRYGSQGRRPKAYIQAGLHADEAPGYLVMHHLTEALDAIDAEGGIKGEVVVVPAANPIGASQWRDDRLQGRFHFSDGVNFNRRFPDLAATVADGVQHRLGGDAKANIRLIREACGRALDETQAVDEAAHLKRKLMQTAHDADIVLDLHCDGQAVMHIYVGTSLWPGARDLSAWLGAQATLLADDSGVTPFDEACSRVWWTLAARFPDHPVPPACLAATVELRGRADLSHAMAAEDAGNIVRFLAGRGLVQGQTEPVAPPALKHEATPLSAVEHVKAPAPGVVIFRKKPGDVVCAGEVVAEVVNPLPSEPAERIHPLRAAADGILFARSADRFARPDRILAKIAGRTPLRAEGENLLTP